MTSDVSTHGHVARGFESVVAQSTCQGHRWEGLSPYGSQEVGGGSTSQYSLKGQNIHDNLTSDGRTEARRT